MLRKLFSFGSATTLLAFLPLHAPADAQQLVYTPINPSFGGNAFNSTQLLAEASAQNQYKASVSTTSGAQTPAQAFSQQLQSRLLSALATQVTDAIFGANPQNQGTVRFGDQTISFIRSLDGISLTITDATGAQTVINVPTLQAQ